MRKRTPRKRPTTCKVCGATAPGARISYRGLCEECAIARHVASVREMSGGAGPMHDAWREGMRRALDRIESEGA